MKRLMGTFDYKTYTIFFRVKVTFLLFYFLLQDIILIFFFLITILPYISTASKIRTTEVSIFN